MSVLEDLPYVSTVAATDIVAFGRGGTFGVPATAQPNYATASQLGTPVILTAAQIASPTASQLADLNAVYRLNVVPYTRYVSNGTRLVSSSAQSVLVSDFISTWDAVTDNTAGINAAIAVAMAPGGLGAITLPPGPGLMTGAMVIPYSGTNNPRQHPLRIIGAGANVDSYLGNSGFGAATPLVGTVLNMTYDGTDPLYPAKITTLGQGVLALENVTLTDTGTSNALFILTTNTTLKFRDVYIVGNPANSGTACLQNAIRLGGITGASTTLGTNVVTDGFQGYSTSIVNLFCSHIKEAIQFGGSANGVYVENLCTDATCGSAAAQGAPVVFYGAGLGNSGNVIIGGIIERQNYPYGVACLGTGGVYYNTFTNLGQYDTTGTSLGDYYFTATSLYNTVIPAAPATATMMAGPGAATNNLIQGNGQGNQLVGDMAMVPGLGSRGMTITLTPDGSGSGGGAMLLFKPGGSIANAVAGYSKFRGGSYDARTLMVGASGIVFGNVSTDQVSVGTAGLNILVGDLIVTTSHTPASASAVGTAGMIAWDSGFLYVCTATNTWKRVAVATW